MAEPSNPFGFGKFVPGFDFLQGLAKQTAETIPQMPNLANWVAPTLNVEELDKRLAELKSVHFWLEQNARALGAVIQALEVQKMTLATLRGMNFNMGDVANALKLKAADTVIGGVQKAATQAAGTARSLGNAAGAVAESVTGRTKPAAGKKAGVVDPLQWWGSIAQQFQQIATTAMKDATRQSAIDTTRNVATGLARGAIKAAGQAVGTATQGATKTKAMTPGKTRATAKKAAKTTRRAASGGS